MKKNWLFALLLFLPLCLVGCGENNKNQDPVVEIQYVERFVFLDDLSNRTCLENGYYVLVDNKTKVQYVFIKQDWGTALTPMYDENGNLILYEGEIKNE